MTNEEVIALTTNEDLKTVLSYIVDSCQGELVGYIQKYDDDVNLLEVHVYSEYFSKKQLDVLFTYSFYGEAVAYVKRKEKMCVNIEYSIKKTV